MDLLYQIFIDPFVQMVTAPDLLVQTLWEGLVSGVLYALIALGFVLIFKASGVFNFAQGIMVVFAALTLVGLYNMLRKWGVRPGGTRRPFRPAACRDVTKGQFVNVPAGLTLSCRSFHMPQ